MTGRVADKVVIVTGAGSGIGRGIALHLAAEGAHVVVADRDVDGGQATAASVSGTGSAVFVAVDVAGEESCRALVEAAVRRYGRLDGLVNNAGIYPRATLEETTLAFFDTMIAINLRGPFLLCREAVPHMVRAGGGCIVNIGSIHGDAGARNLAAYAVSKGGLLTLTRHVARSYARHRVRANLINPGWVITEGEIRTEATQGIGEEWLRQKGAERPMGRHQTPDDIAHAVVYLISDESSQLTGSHLHVDGGISLNPSSEIVADPPRV
jgi:NAD(P)-dependent dehydrogenase (short-subunit alcohol dehydrogenase family)